ncbi:50S ribosomal protein L13 [Candidatus Uhrbacteria bacterium]|nr:50S ribosomal protein L13 [Candidatus Uhrbacteria bacterium]
MAPKKSAPIKREIHTLNATDRPLGRLATQIAVLLRGKNKPTFQPHIDAGDSVVVAHAAQVKLTGQKLTQKVYQRHSGYPGGLKTKKLSSLFADDPSQVLHRAVFQMLPDNRLRKHMIKRLTISN